jgi:hypothetical protein
VLVDTGKAAVAKQVAGINSPENLTFGLYTNSYTWLRTTTLADLTVAAWSGYAAVTIPLGSWTSLGLDGAFNAILQATALASFTNSTGGTVTAQGFYVVGASSGIFYGGYAFSSALAITAGQTVTTYPQLAVNTLLP